MVADAEVPFIRAFKSVVAFGVVVREGDGFVAKVFFKFSTTAGVAVDDSATLFHRTSSSFIRFAERAPLFGFQDNCRASIS